jgi:hypothetical protein
VLPMPSSCCEETKIKARRSGIEALDIANSYHMRVSNLQIRENQMPDLLEVTCLSRSILGISTLPISSIYHRRTRSREIILIQILNESQKLKITHVLLVI